MDSWIRGGEEYRPAIQRITRRISGSADQPADQRISPADQRISGSAQRISGSAQRINGSADHPSGSADQRISPADRRISGSAQRIGGSADQPSGSADQRIRQPSDHKSLERGKSQTKLSSQLLCMVTFLHHYTVNVPFTCAE